MIPDHDETRYVSESKRVSFLFGFWIQQYNRGARIMVDKAIESDGLCS